MFMKVNRDKIPFKPQEFEINYSPSDEDVSHMENLVKEGRLNELYDFINNKMVGAELESDAPGTPTRDFLSEALSKSIRKAHPELDSLSSEQKLQYFKDQVYPGLDYFRRKMKLYPLKLKAVSHIGSSYNHDTGVLNYDRAANKAEEEAVMLHELGHAVDHPVQDQAVRDSQYSTYDRPVDPDSLFFENYIDSQFKRKMLDKYIQKLPKLSKLEKYGQQQTTNSEVRGWGGEGYSKIKRMPNFEDYDWKSGDFNSDVIQDPVKKYQDVGTDHHSGRAFSLDNFINFARGGLKDVVKNEDRFKTLRKKLS
jgi:hypothetical protein